MGKWGDSGSERLEKGKRRWKGKEGVIDMDTVQESKEGVGKEHILVEAKPLPTKLGVGFG